MRFSIITATKNNKEGLLRAIECVRSQTYKNVEHIVVDGGSVDGSTEILRNFDNPSINSGHRLSAGSTQEDTLRQAQGDSLLTTHYTLITISEPDEGIYDAINKGIKLATGDVIGLLHSDDLYADENVLEKYARAFASDSGSESGMKKQVDAVYSDLVYVKKKSGVGSQDSEDDKHTSIHSYNHSSQDYSIIRYWKTHKSVISNQSSVKSENTENRLLVTDDLLKKGWMPPHPTLFIRREIFEKYGLYRTDLKIAADYEMILRLLFKHKITAYYLPLTTYLMQLGGASNKSLTNILLKSKEDYFSMKKNGISFPLVTLLNKNLRKLPQFLAR